MENKMTPKQALEELEEKAKLFICNDGYVCDLVKPIYQALAQLEEIKVFNKSLEKDINRLNEQCTNLHLKDKKQTEILEVLKNKQVNFLELKENIINCDSDKRALEIYNERHPYDEEYNDTQLTETEFNLIKEWLK